MSRVIATYWVFNFYNLCTTFREPLLEVRCGTMFSRTQGPQVFGYNRARDISANADVESKLVANSS